MCPNLERAEYTETGLLPSLICDVTETESTFDPVSIPTSETGYIHSGIFGLAQDLVYGLKFNRSCLEAA